MESEQDMLQSSSPEEELEEAFHSLSDNSAASEGDEDDDHESESGEDDDHESEREEDDELGSEGLDTQENESQRTLTSVHPADASAFGAKISADLADSSGAGANLTTDSANPALVVDAYHENATVEQGHVKADESDQELPGTTFVLPEDKLKATRFLNQKYNTILRLMRQMEAALAEGSTGFFYFRPKFGDARQIVTQNIPLQDSASDMTHLMFINHLEGLAKSSEGTFELRNQPIEDPSWELVSEFLHEVDVDCLKKTVRAIKHLFADYTSVELYNSVFSLKKKAMQTGLLHLFGLSGVSMKTVWKDCFGGKKPKVIPSSNKMDPIPKFMNLLRAMDVAHLIKEPKGHRLPKHSIEGGRISRRTRPLSSAVGSSSKAPVQGSAVSLVKTPLSIERKAGPPVNDSSDESTSSEDESPLKERTSRKRKATASPGNDSDTSGSSSSENGSGSEDGSFLRGLSSLKGKGVARSKDKSSVEKRVSLEEIDSPINENLPSDDSASHKDPTENPHVLKKRSTVVEVVVPKANTTEIMLPALRIRIPLVIQKRFDFEPEDLIYDVLPPWMRCQTGNIIDWQGQKDARHLETVDSLARNSQMFTILAREMRIGCGRHLQEQVLVAANKAISEGDRKAMKRILLETQNMLGLFDTDANEDEARLLIKQIGIILENMIE